MVTFLCALLIGFSARKLPDVTVKTESYKIWPGSFRISNGIVDVVVVPQIGRIMRFGDIGQRNLLFEALLVNGEPPSGGGWRNWGGDKVWPAPQDAWGWPPETEYDGTAWEAHAIPNGVEMASKTASSKLGVRFKRTILLKKGARTAEIRSTLINASGKTVRFAAWEVCQVDDPTVCILPIWKSKTHPTGWRVYADDKVDGLVNERDSQLFITRDLKRGHKYGSASPNGTIRAQVGNYLLSVASKFDFKAQYPDEGNAQQVYTNSDPIKYAELELTGPLTTLSPGQNTSITVTMTLARNKFD
jgi:hypothetical protein